MERSTSSPSVWVEGLVVGLIGYAAVALFVGLFDLVTGRPFFHTVATLGRGLVADPGPPGTIDPGAVFAFNGLHLFAFLAIGVVIAKLAHAIELHPVFWYLAFFFCLGVFFASVAAISALDPHREALPGWVIVAANVVAGVLMGSYLLRRHPSLWTAMRRSGTEGDEG